MIEKINTKDYNNGLVTEDSLNKVRAIDSSGNDILVSPDIVANSGGCGILKGILEQNKWYRIAIGAFGSRISTAIINISKYYSNSIPGSQVFYVSADGYSNNPTVIQIARGGALIIGKARILYKESTTERIMLDVYVVSNSENLFFISYSNNINFSFQTHEEVSADIPEGYSVKEFTF